MVTPHPPGHYLSSRQPGKPSQCLHPHGVSTPRRAVRARQLPTSVSVVTLWVNQAVKCRLCFADPWHVAHLGA